MPEEKVGWPRASDPAISAAAVERIVARALPGHRLLAVEPLTGGLSNCMLRIRVDELDDPLVVRVYTRDLAACGKEVALHRLLAATVPVPEILSADCNGDDTSPYAIMRWVEGITFREIKQRRDGREIAECARAIGAVLASIGNFKFSHPGSLGPDLAVGAPLLEGIGAFIEACLSSAPFERRMTAADRDRVRAYVARWEPGLERLAGERSLVHSDFGSPNLLLREVAGCWNVAAVLDWEFAYSGSPLADVGHMMRYERRDSPRIEPHFSRSFREHGGVLPDNWRCLCRALDLSALCEFLRRPELPDPIVPDLLELIFATVEEC